MIKEIDLATGSEATRNYTDVEIAALPKPTVAEQVAHADSVIETLLDEIARRKGYKSADRLAGFATDQVYAADAAAFIAYRSSVWVHCIALFDSVMSGSIAAPTDAELLAGLPIFTAW